ncbi:MAG: hypothetical protein EA424_17640 [Planctomycetaceae bacterium]|nr:MAG: hypothetical protein EA424_17640 [Planctomycetaceae bacterium]
MQPWGLPFLVVPGLWYCYGPRHFGETPFAVLKAALDLRRFLLGRPARQTKLDNDKPDRFSRLGKALR